MSRVKLEHLTMLHTHHSRKEWPPHFLPDESWDPRRELWERWSDWAAWVEECSGDERVNGELFPVLYSSTV